MENRFLQQKNVKSDIRNHPLAVEEVDKSKEFRLVCIAGDSVCFQMPFTWNNTNLSIRLDLYRPKNLIKRIL